MNTAGRKRRVAITLADLPPRASLAAEDRVRIANLAMALQGDPLGISTGQYAARQKWTVGDATEQRMQHARCSGDRLVLEQECFEDGRPTGLSRKRFVGRLEQLRNRGTIDQTAFAGGELFQKHVAMAAMKAGARIVDYNPRWIDCAPAPELLPAEIAFHHATIVARTYASLPVELHCALHWLERAVIDGQDYTAAARQYWPNLSDRVREEKFRGFIELTCAILARHFGLDQQHRWAKLQISQVAEEIYGGIMRAA